jgi:hypothetical protein
MGRFYFDFRDDTVVSRDDDGEELSSAAIAHDVALKTVGDAVKDMTRSSSQGRIEIQVRDGQGPIFKVLASVQTTF